MKYHILMADIVASREKESIALLSVFQNLVKAVNRKFKNDLLVPCTISLGDEFQAVTSSLKVSIQVIVFMEEQMILQNTDFKLRYVSHYGTIDTPIGRGTKTVMLGNGLIAAREALNRMKRSDGRFHFSSEQKNAIICNLMNNSFVWFQSICDSWKGNDFGWLKLFLSDKDYKEIAISLGVTRSTAWRRYRSLRIHEFRTAKALIFALL